MTEDKFKALAELHKAEKREIARHKAEMKRIRKERDAITASCDHRSSDGNSLIVGGFTHSYCEVCGWHDL